MCCDLDELQSFFLKAHFRCNLEGLQRCLCVLTIGALAESSADVAGTVN